MEELKMLEPYPMFGEPKFPDSTERPEGVISVTWTDAPAPFADVLPNVVYQELSGEQQHLQIFKPMTMFAPPDQPPQKFPLIVYVPGSAWHRQNVWIGLGKALEAVARGYAFAIVEYRPSDIAPFPAQIADAKSAIRFLRAHADEYGLDASKIALWGDSSGGHTAVSLAVMDGIPDNGEHTDEPFAVDCVIDFFGPTDVQMMAYYPSAMDHLGPDSPEGYLIGRKDVHVHTALAQKTNPINYINSDSALPPLLMMHGSSDNIVAFNQSVRLYDKLCECGKEVVFYRLEGAGHGMGGFTSREAMETVFSFIAEKLK